MTRKVWLFGVWDARRRRIFIISTSFCAIFLGIFLLNNHQYDFKVMWYKEEW
jgi:hypothetical protein